jgi:hypothetical protein
MRMRSAGVSPLRFQRMFGLAGRAARRQRSEGVAGMRGSVPAGRPFRDLNTPTIERRPNCCRALGGIYALVSGRTMHNSRTSRPFFSACALLVLVAAAAHAQEKHKVMVVLTGPVTATGCANVPGPVSLVIDDEDGRNERGIGTESDRRSCTSTDRRGRRRCCRGLGRQRVSRGLDRAAA